VWVKVKLRNNVTGSLEESFDEKELLHQGFGECQISRRSNIQSRKMIAGQDVLRFEQNLGGEEHENNPGILAFTRNGVCGARWGGALLVMHYHETEEGVRSYRDVDSYDLRHAADYLSAMNRANRTRPAFGLFHACFITCPAYFGASASEYRDLVVDTKDPVFMKEGSDIATCIELPLLIRKDARPFDDTIANLERPLYYNHQAMMLKRDLHSLTTAPGPGRDFYGAYQAIMLSLAKEGLEDEDAIFGYVESDGEFGFGSSPVMWSGETLVGNIVVARVDGKPLLEQHLEAIYEYIVQEVDPRIQAAISGLQPGSEVPTRESVIASINKDDFLKFFLRYKQEKAQTQPAWSLLGSPYNVKIDESTKIQMLQAYHEQWSDGMEPWALARERFPGIGGCLA
jgi:hypothetical protein